MSAELVSTEPTFWFLEGPPQYVLIGWKGGGSSLSLFPRPVPWFPRALPTESDRLPTLSPRGEAAAPTSWQLTQTAASMETRPGLGSLDGPAVAPAASQPARISVYPWEKNLSTSPEGEPERPSLSVVLTGSLLFTSQ